MLRSGFCPTPFAGCGGNRCILRTVKYTVLDNPCPTGLTKRLRQTAKGLRNAQRDGGVSVADWDCQEARKKLAPYPQERA